MALPPPTRTKVFISYSHADKEWLERLKRHLKPLVRDGYLDCWDDTHIRPGDDWKQEIRNALDTAQTVVLLISADFFASDFIDETELPPLLTAAQAKGVRVLPVILSASRFARDPALARFQAVNSPDRPLNEMPPAEQEKVLDRLAQSIESATRGFSSNPSSVCRADTSEGLPGAVPGVRGEATEGLASRALPGHLPKLVFYPVNKDVLQPLLKPYLYLSGALASAGGIGVSVTEFWDKIPLLMDYFQLRESIQSASPTFLTAVLCALVAFVLLFGIKSRLIDFQLTYSVARTALLLALWYMLCSILSLFPKLLIAHMLLLVLIVMFILGMSRMFLLGNLGFYWKRRSYGDIAIELAVMFAFVYLAWLPIQPML